MASIEVPPGAASRLQCRCSAWPSRWGWAGSSAESAPTADAGEGLRPANSATADSAHTSPTTMKLFRGDRKVSREWLSGIVNCGMGGVSTTAVRLSVRCRTQESMVGCGAASVAARIGARLAARSLSDVIERWRGRCALLLRDRVASGRAGPRVRSGPSSPSCLCRHGRRRESFGGHRNLHPVQGQKQVRRLYLFRCFTQTWSSACCLAVMTQDRGATRLTLARPSERSTTTHSQPASTSHGRIENFADEGNA